MACRMNLLTSRFLGFVSGLLAIGTLHAGEPASANWKLGEPIVTYWCGPGFPGVTPLDDPAAGRLKKGGWNLVWCHEKELDVAHRHGLRAILYHPLLSDLNATGDPERLKQLDALIERVKDHPALDSYYIVDEPNAEKFPAIAKHIDHIRSKDPARLCYINLLPTYANNEQLGIRGNKITAYTGHIDQYVDLVRPRLISYDHYHFTNTQDNPDYFLNLEIIRQKALSSGVPFLNIVQACSWIPGTQASPSSPRVPTPDEMRFLVYTTLAYGGQGISYYVYSHPRHKGGMVDQQGNPTVLYREMETLNPEFISIAKVLQPLESLGVVHSGMKLNGVRMSQAGSPFLLTPPHPEIPYKPGEKVRGTAIGLFGEKGAAPSAATHAVVVNLDYQAVLTVHLESPAAIEVFDPGNASWSPAGGTTTTLSLKRGGGKLVRLKP